MLLIDVIAGEPKDSPTGGSGGIIFLAVLDISDRFGVATLPPYAALNLDGGFGRWMCEIEPPFSFRVKGEFLDEFRPVHNPPKICETNLQNRAFRLFLFCPHKISGVDPTRTHARWLNPVFWRGMLFMLF
jgi:hypothetical protein